MRYRDLPQASQTLILLNAAAALTAAFFVRPYWQPTPWSSLFLAVLLCLILFQFTVRLMDGKGLMSFGFAGMLASAFAWGPAVGMLVGFIAGTFSSLGPDLIKCKREKHPPSLPLVRAFYNGCTGAVSTAAAGLVFHFDVLTRHQHRFQPAPLTSEKAWLYGMGATLVLFLVSTWLTAAILATTRRKGVVAFWHSELLYTFPHHIVGSVGAITVLLVSRAERWPLMVLGVLVSMAAVHECYRRAFDSARRRRRQITELEGLNDAVVASLAGAIDARSQRDDSHLARVQHLALAICDQLGLPEEERQAVRCAALIHDVGKLGVPRELLEKPGPLTRSEYEIVKRHVALGVEILRPVEFPWPVVDLVMAHHERWDGNGYPLGLQGDSIPLGARIIAVADAFDAAMRGGLGRSAMNAPEAFRAVHNLGGSFFDARVVAALKVALCADPPPSVCADVPAPVCADSQAEDAAPAVCLPTPAMEESPAPAHGIATYGLRLALRNPADLQGTVETLAREAMRLVPGTTALVALTDATGKFHVAATSGLYSDRLAGLSLPSPSSTWGQALREGKPLLNVAPDPVIARALPAEMSPALQSALVIPLIHAGEALGVTSVYHTRRNAYTEQHVERLALVAEIIAESLALAMQANAAEAMSRQDPLTELANDRALAQRLEAQLEGAKATRTPFALILLDIDNIKAVNDQLGHLEGDRVLCRAAEAVRKCIRPSDFLARYAGDKFVVILEEATREVCVRVCSRITTAIERIAEDVSLPIGASAGYSLFPDDGASPRALLDSADRRMYIDKSAHESR